MGNKQSTKDFVNTMSGVIGTTCEIGTKLAPLAMMANAGSLTSAEMRPVVNAWNRLLIAAGFYSIIVPSVPLPTLSSQVGDFLRVIKYSSESVHEALSADASTILGFVSRYPTKVPGQHFDVTKLSVAEIVINDRFNAIFEAFGLDAKADSLVQAAAITDSTLQVGSSGSLAAKYSVNKKQMGPATGLNRDAAPERLDEGNAPKTKTSDSSWLGPLQEHALFTEVSHVNASDINEPSNNLTPGFSTMYVGGYDTATLLNPMPVEWSEGTAGYTSVAGSTARGRYNLLMGAIPSARYSALPPISAPGTSVQDMLVLIDPTLTGAGLSPGYSVAQWTMPITVNNAGQMDAGGTFVMSIPESGAGLSIKRGAGSIPDDGYGWNVSVKETFDGVTDTVTPSLGLRDGSIAKTEKVGIVLTVDLYVPPNVRGIGDHAPLYYWAYFTNTHTGEFFSRLLLTQQNTVGVSTKDADIRISDSIEVPVGTYNVTILWMTEVIQQLTPASGSSPSHLAVATGMGRERGVVTGFGGVSADVTAQLSRKPRSGQQTTGSALITTKTLGGTDRTVMQISDSTDVLMTPHFPRGGASSASKSARRAVPSTTALIGRSALNDTHIDSDLDSLGAYFSKASGDATWQIASSMGDITIFHPTSALSMLALPSATAHTTGAMNIMLEWKKAYPDTYAVFASDIGAPDWIFRLRLHLGFPVNLEALLRLAADVTLVDAEAGGLGALRIPLLSKRQYNELVDHSELITATLSQVSSSANVIAQTIHSETVPDANEATN